MDNLMVRPDGTLFHIDFGYVMGRDPKPKMLGVGAVRVDATWFAACGAENKHIFKAMIHATFTVLRRHQDVLVPMLRVLGQMDSVDPSEVELHCGKVFWTGKHSNSPVTINDRIVLQGTTRRVHLRVSGKRSLLLRTREQIGFGTSFMTALAKSTLWRSA